MRTAKIAMWAALATGLVGCDLTSALPFASSEQTVVSPSETDGPGEITGVAVAPQPTETAALVEAEPAEEEPPARLPGRRAPPRIPVPPPRPKDPYQAMLYDLELKRADLERRRDYWEEDPDAIASEGAVILAETLPRLLEYWKGTRWSYSGTSQVPKRGKIACGYYVSTVLEHAGFAVDRVDLARQPSEQIIRTLVPDAAIERFRYHSPSRMAKVIEARGRACTSSASTPTSAFW